jgi:hypothetical protein
MPVEWASPAADASAEYHAADDEKGFTEVTFFRQVGKKGALKRKPGGIPVEIPPE